MDKRKMESNNLKWQLYDDGTMVVECRGNIPHFFGNNKKRPWEERKDEIKHIIFADGVRTIGALAFSDCKKLISVDFPKTIRIIDYSAFAGCVSLEEVILPDGMILRHSGAVDRECSLSQNILLMKRQAFLGTPWAKEQWGDFITERKVLLEYYGTDEEVIIPEEIQKIAKFAFKDKPIRSVIFPSSLENIDVCAFEGTKLTKVDLPESLKELGFGAFLNNRELSCVYMFNDDTIIGDQAFAECGTEENPLVVRGHAPSVIKNRCVEMGINFRKDHKRVERFRRIPDMWEEKNHEYMLKQTKAKYVILTIVVNEETKEVEFVKSYSNKMIYISGDWRYKRCKCVREYHFYSGKYKKKPWVNWYKLKECQQKYDKYGLYPDHPFHTNADFKTMVNGTCRCENYLSWEYNKWRGKIEKAFLEWWLKENPGYYFVGYKKEAAL